LKIYTNNKYKYIITYPESYIISSLDPSTTNLDQADSINFRKKDDPTPATSGFVFFASDNPKNLNFVKWAEDVVGPFVIPDDIKETEILIAGKYAWENFDLTTIAGVPSGQVIYALNTEGKMYYILNYQNTEPEDIYTVVRYFQTF
jgi:hypothetical protein